MAICSEVKAHADRACAARNYCTDGPLRSSQSRISNAVTDLKSRLLDSLSKSGTSLESLRAALYDLKQH